VTTTRIEDLLESAIGEVLESMCFLSVESVSAGVYEGDDSLVSQRLTFRGPERGSFGICVPLTTARIIASNLLGQEQIEVSESQAAEAIGEVANMICGTLLSRLHSVRAFDLTSPERDESSLDPEIIANGISKTFVLDEGMITAWIVVEPAC
jgi:CheY-specific phosphatase CheX